jgi:hypothetical protein
MHFRMLEPERQWDGRRIGPAIGRLNDLLIGPAGDPMRGV